MSETESQLPTNKTSGYDTVYAVDFYHSITQIPGLLQDAFIYLGAYQQALQLRLGQPTQESPFVILDVCTGTGRVIRDLVAHLSQRGDALDATKFLGLDISQLMLDQAARLPLASPTADVAWIQGSALDLSGVPALCDGSLKVDLLIVAFSSISHFIEPGQGAQFLKEVARVLKPRTGRAYVSMRDITSTVQSDPATSGGEVQRQELPSSVLPGISYRQIRNQVQVSDNVVYVTSDVEVLNGDGNIVGTELATTAFRIWKENELQSVASNVGLNLLEIVEEGGESFYVFQLP
jgi:SAM-dependent methyltransferase